MTINTIILYIDPGTGSLLISTLIGIILTVSFSAKNLFYKLTYIIGGNSKKIVSDFSDQLVFFSEGQIYWRVFEPVIKELINNKHKIVYLTADKEDEGLSLNSDMVDAHYIGNIKQAIFVLNRLKARTCVMTTPQLDVIALKRSKGVKHYCHIIHSPTDIHSYKKFAFDYFDSVLCSSTFQITNLKQLESARNSVTKKLFETGCTYYDVFESNIENRGDAILVAPTWGNKTFFKSHGKEVISNLLDGGHKVILRPHPQSWISDKELLDDIILTFDQNDYFAIDKNVNGEMSISKSKLLICDATSGILFDMAFMYKKPVVAIDFDWHNGGYEASDIIKETASINLLKDVGDILKVNDIKNISNIAKKAYEKKITQEIIDKHIFNFRKAGPVAAEQIVSIFNEVK